MRFQVQLWHQFWAGWAQVLLVQNGSELQVDLIRVHLNISIIEKKPINNQVQIRDELRDGWTRVLWVQNGSELGVDSI